MADGWDKSLVYVGDELVLEKDGVITAEDIFRIKGERGLGTIDVIDMETGASLSPEDFPRTGKIKIVPVYKAGSF